MEEENSTNPIDISQNSLLQQTDVLRAESYAIAPDSGSTTTPEAPSYPLNAETNNEQQESNRIVELTDEQKQKKELLREDPGFYCWVLFHTLANKFTEEIFTNVGIELVQHIIKICTVHPCQRCRNDAIEAMTKYNFIEIKTKEELGVKLFEFHNSVNAKNKKDLFIYDNLDSTYGVKDINIVLEEFLLTGWFVNDETKNAFKSWFDENMHYFR